MFFVAFPPVNLYSYVLRQCLYLSLMSKKELIFVPVMIDNKDFLIV